MNPARLFFILIAVGLAFVFVNWLYGYAVTHPDLTFMAAIGIAAIARAWWVHGVGPWSKRGRVGERQACVLAAVASTSNQPIHSNNNTPHQGRGDTPTLDRYTAQLQSLHAAKKIRKVPLLNAGECEVFHELRKLLRDKGQQKYTIHAQVSVGEFIKAEPDDAFRAINTKRVDFLIIDAHANRAVVDINNEVRVPDTRQREVADVDARAENDAVIVIARSCSLLGIGVMAVPGCIVILVVAEVASDISSSAPLRSA